MGIGGNPCFPFLRKSELDICSIGNIPVDAVVFLGHAPPSGKTRLAISGKLLIITSEKLNPHYFKVIGVIGGNSNLFSL